MTPSSDAEMDDRLVFIQLQIAQRIDKERGAAADFLAQHADARARMVVGFHHDIFQFLAQILLDGGFVLLLHFRVIRQHSDGAKILAAVPFVGGKKLLHRFAGVGVVVEDLRERGMARANACERIAQGIRFLGGCVPVSGAVRAMLRLQLRRFCVCS